MVRCKYCNADNINEARYCRKCGKIIDKELEPAKQPYFGDNIENNINLYPDYQFQPVSLVKIPVKSAIHVWRFIFLLIAIASLAMTSYLSGNKGDQRWFIALFFASALIFILLLICIRRKPLKRAKADYIQKKGSPVRLIVKDGKFGIYNVKNHKIVVEPQYDILRVKDGAKYIYTALKDGKQFEIDVHGNILK